MSTIPTVDGEQSRLEGHLYVVRALMDRDGISIADARLVSAGVVPAEDQDAIEQLWHGQTSTTITVD